MTRPPAIYRHRNNTDTLDAIVLTAGAWSATGAITGDNSAETGKYVFDGLAENTAYEIRIRAGGSPAASDLAIAPIPVPIKTEVREAISGRWTNQGTGTGYDDIAIEDTPE